MERPVKEALRASKNVRNLGITYLAHSYTVINESSFRLHLIRM